MDDTASSFGLWLRHRRRELDLTQDELARRVGCARITIRKMEAAQLRPSKQMVELLRAQLGVPPEERESFLRFARGGNWAARPILARPKHNLPLQLTTFVGRERELAEIRRFLGSRRLLTLTGSGGVGKTRLALELAAKLLDEFSDGVWLVDLAPISDGDLIARMLLRILGLSARPAQQPLLFLVDHLADKSILLLLDNCEHLLGDCSSLTQAVLQAGPAVKVLATSREALGVAGEQTYRVPSLPAPDLDQLPSAGELAQFDSVQLFVDRAALVSPGFALIAANAAPVAQICRQLDGIPLAIELAAARLHSMPLEMLVSRLDDRFRLLSRGLRTDLPRHQTLRAMMDWSYDLLSNPERLLLQRLSVFRGGRTQDAAEAVCSGDEIERPGVLGLLSSLTDKSLLALDEHGRYRMLETVREYATEKLSASGQAARVRDRHLEYMVQLAEQAEPELTSHNQLIWLDRLDADLNNLRAALAWGQQRNPEAFLRLAKALWRFWDLRFLHAEGKEWLKRALTMTEHLHTVLRARALARMASFYINHMDVRQARQAAEQAYALASHLEDEISMADALEMLDYAAFYEEKPVSGWPAEKALSLARQIGDHWRMASILWMLGQHARFRNDLTSARSFFEEGLEEARLSGDGRITAGTLLELGNLSVAQGDAEGADAFLQAGERIARDMGDTPNLSDCVHYQAALELLREDYVRARQLAEESYRLKNSHGLYAHAVLARIYSGIAEAATGNFSGSYDCAQNALAAAGRAGDAVSEATALCRLGDALRLKGEPEAAHERYVRALEVSRREHFEEGYCYCLEGLGAIELASGSATHAVSLFAARAKVRETILAEDFYPFFTREREQLLAQARSELGDEAFDTAWAAGQGMSEGEMLDYALESPGRAAGRP